MIAPLHTVVIPESEKRGLILGAIRGETRIILRNVLDRGHLKLRRGLVLRV